MHWSVKILVSIIILLVAGSVFHVLADHYDDEEKDRHERAAGRNEKHHSSSHHAESETSFAEDPVYKETCGACHLAYPPILLPSASWGKIMAGLDNHFGQTVGPDAKKKAAISAYLRTNAAENSSSKTARKIMKKKPDQMPLRITEMRYIQKKHNRISADVLRRKSIGSLSNCTACHKTAEQGIFEDDLVQIPWK